MKKTKQILFVVVAIMLTTSSFATIRTVSNSPSTTIAQFSTIQAAVDVSVSGDTVLIHGSPIHYSGFTITNKQLVILGPGWSPDKAFSFSAVVQGLTITGVSSSNSEIQGLVFTGGVNIISGIPSNIRFIRNNFASDISLNSTGGIYTGYLFEGNLINNKSIIGHASALYQNFVVKNNYFHIANFFTAIPFHNFNNPLNTILLDHNLWFGPSSGSLACFFNCGYLLITNNIFVRRDAASGNSLSVFSSNITFNAGNNSPWSSNGNSDSGGNISNQDPQMTDQASVNAGTNNPLLDFTIAAGPANNTGTDGKDMGLLYDVTGSLNWTNSRNSRLPRIFSMNITNTTITSGGILNVNVEARKSN